jgi:hypothetical protein
MLLFVMLHAVAADSAQAGSLRIAGTGGYLPEWELNGDVTEKISGDAKEFSGPLIWKPIGLCSVNGPQEKTGEIDFQISGSGALSRIHATLWLEGAQCKYTGNLSDSSGGLMDCSDAKGVPLTLSFR